MAKFVKFTKIQKTLKAPLFMFSPSRAGGSFLSHEGGRKSVRWKTELQGVTCRGKLRGLLRLQPLTSPQAEAWRVLVQRNYRKEK